MRSFLTVVGGIAILIWMNPLLSLLMLLMIPGLAIGAVQVRKVIQRRARHIQDLVAEANAGLKESVVGIETVQIFQMEERETRRYSSRIMNAFSAHLPSQRREAHSCGNTVSWLLAMGLICMGCRTGIGRKLYGGTECILLYTVMVTGSLMGLVEVDHPQRAVGASVRIFDILNEAPTIADPENPEELLHPKGHITFENVHFAYPTRADVPVLRGVHFEIHPGETVALVGSSAGKSTIAVFLQRFYDPSEGRILLDGHALPSLALDSLRGEIAMVHQDPIPFRGA